MKAIALSLLFILTASFAGAQTPAVPAGGAAAPQRQIIRQIQIQPESKRPLSLKVTERNPYARRTEDQNPVTEIGADSEEARIRKVLQGLAVSGSSRGPNGDLKLQMGDITLQNGRVLPQLLENQTENLRVTEITKNTITFGWMDVETSELTGKTMQIGYDLTPKITYQLSGQNTASADDSKKKPTPKYGVMRLRPDRPQANARYAADDPDSRDYR